ncbi:hypothetical protein PspLS_04992 [Pyricularia sp. CBS 133598]|nr:hypothetical protein PspLS_04992 [Pyricularia sp. CBS 133598]
MQAFSYWRTSYLNLVTKATRRAQAACHGGQGRKSLIWPPDEVVQQTPGASCCIDHTNITTAAAVTTKLATHPTPIALPYFRKDPSGPGYLYMCLVPASLTYVSILPYRTYRTLNCGGFEAGAILPAAHKTWAPVTQDSCVRYCTKDITYIRSRCIRTYEIHTLPYLAQQPAEQTTHQERTSFPEDCMILSGDFGPAPQGKD